MYNVSVTGTATTPTTFAFSLGGGTATAGVDYGTPVFGPGVTNNGNGTITIAAGVTSFTVTVATTQDTIDEPNETVPLTVGGVTATGTITDDDATPALSINDVSVNEAAGTATFTVTLSAASGQTVTVGYNTSNVTASAGSDYTAIVAGTLTFAPGVTTQTVVVNIANDGTYEGAETFNVNLVTPTNATISDNLGLGTIMDNGTGLGGTDNDTPTLAVSSVTVTEGTNAYVQFTVSLSNPSVQATTVSLALANGTATGGGVDYGSGTGTNLQVSTDNGTTWTNATSTTIAAGTTSVLVRTPITDDLLLEPTENFTLTATRTAGTTSNASAVGMATIVSNDAFSVTSTVSDDDDVNENRDVPTSNDITHTGVISNVASNVTLSIDASVASGVTSNGKTVTYAWDAATHTLTASTTDGAVFTVILNATNDGYVFRQVAGIDHPVLAGENQSLNIPLTVVAQDGAGAQLATAGFNITVWDDAPTVSGNRTITTENDGTYLESGFLTQATVSNDVTHITWNTAGLPNLVFDGKTVLYVDHGDGTLTGQLADGTLIFSVQINPNVIDANGSPQYTFELLNALGSLGIEGAATSYTVISGGNVANLDLGFGNYLIDNMTATDSAGAVSTVNTNNNWIGIGGNWFDPGEKLSMSFADPSGGAGQVRGMSMVVEGQGSAAYTLNWTVTAAIDAAGHTVTYSGSVSGTGNTDHPFTIPLQNGALYFTDLQISDPTGGGNFRMAFSAITANDYHSDIPLGLSYTMTDADGDTAGGLINVTLTTPVVLTGTSGADTLTGTSSADLLSGMAGNDTLNGGGGDDTILGGVGNDIMTGGIGADTFKWVLGDHGTAGSPALDRITDFDTTSNSDKLNLRDLLQGENHITGAGNLLQYLHFERIGTDTVIHVSSTGNLATNEDQRITLTSVDLTTIGTDQAIIQDLLNKGKLIVD
ncbi:MAG: type I secretion C-terminal target domain-containing protein [Nitrosomonadales bacterium]|nr:type I secretion C-terminal target domain-containing protein [Nitrosomonadales bacterium]